MTSQTASLYNKSTHVISPLTQKEKRTKKQEHLSGEPKAQSAHRKTLPMAEAVQQAILRTG